MKFYIQKLFNLFHELPANLSSTYLRSYVFSNYAFLLCGFMHLFGIFLFTILFIITGVKVLVLYNIASVLI